MPFEFEPVLTTILSQSAIAVAKSRHYPYKEKTAAKLWGLGLQRHSIPTAYSWGHNDVPAEVRALLATRLTHHEMSGQVIQYNGRQYFALFHHTAEHCAIIADCFKKREPYLSLVSVNYIILPDRS